MLETPNFVIASKHEVAYRIHGGGLNIKCRYPRAGEKHIMCVCKADWTRNMNSVKESTCISLIEYKTKAKDCSVYLTALYVCMLYNPTNTVGQRFLLL